MARYNFVLRFALPDPKANPAHFTDALFEVGCDDAVAGIGMPGAIALDFSREAPSAEEAVSSAIDAVMKAIPGVKLVQIDPQLPLRGNERL